MAKEYQNIIMYRDSDQILEFEVIDVESLNDAFIKWQMASSIDGTPILTKTSDDSSEIEIDGNIFKVIITPEDNKDLEIEDYYHEARITDGTGKTRPVANGRVSVRDTLTESEE
ncbi:MAG: hypothetical protein ACOCRO_05360 [Halanaerobiales bacterium]